MKRSTALGFVASLELVLQGAAVLPADALAAALEALSSSSSSPTLQPRLTPPIRVAPQAVALSGPFPPFHLSAREQAVLDHLAQGLSNKEIARALSISDSTVKVHVKAILRKSRARNRTEVATWASRQQARAAEPVTWIDPNKIGEPAYGDTDFSLTDLGPGIPSVAVMDLMSDKSSPAPENAG